MNRNINWHSRNDVRHPTGPDSTYLTSQVWMNDLEDDIQANGVEIIELNSTDDSQASTEDPPAEDNPAYVNHPWSYAGMLNNSEESKANRQARLKRRLRNRNGLLENGALDNEIDSSLYFNNTRTPDSAEVEAFNQTCFSILDKLSALKLDSSPDDFDVGKEASGNVMLEAGWNGEGEGGEELVTYTSELDGEKHTIWIYSFKNRRILSDFSFESANIPSRESVSSTSPSEVDEELSTSKSTRVSSPIPATHIPRLNLSLGATLPNVTEVTEPKSSESMNRRNHVPITQKPANNWCLDNSDKATITENKVTNIVNWMALSPRERRRHSLSDAPIPLQPVTEVSKDEEKVQVEQVREKIEAKITEPVVFNAEKSNLEYKIETADESKFSNASSQMNSQRSSFNSRRERLGDNATYLISPFAPRHGVTHDLSLNAENKLSKTPSKTSHIHSQRSSTTRKEKLQDNATYLISPFPPRHGVNIAHPYKAENEAELAKLRNAVRSALSDGENYRVQRPRITIGKPLLLSPITRPIENLDSNEWIVHEPKPRQDRRAMSAGDRLMIRNLSLLKPAEWRSYSPITGSRLSIHLEPELAPRRTLLQRCVNYFKCCK